jgi:hypothetical protein
VLAIAGRLVEQARADGIALTGDGRLLPAFMARVLERDCRVIRRQVECEVMLPDQGRV